MLSGLGLGHVSIGESQGRRLLLWKNHQFVPTAGGVNGPSEVGRTDEFAEPVRRFDTSEFGTQLRQTLAAEHAGQLAFDAAVSDGPYDLNQSDADTPHKPKKEKMPKVSDNKVGPDHEALRVPMLNSRGREVVGNPAALIEVVEDASGALIEGSRGFVLPKAWRVAAEPLTSRTEPLVNQHRSRAHKTTGILSSFESVGQDYWNVCHSATDSTKSAKKKKVWAAIDLPEQCSGQQLLSALGLWLTACGIPDHSDSRLHGPMARKLICQAFSRADDGRGLLADMLASIAAAEKEGLETLDRCVAIGHVVLGALTGKKMLSKRAEADLKRQQSAEAPRKPTRNPPELRVTLRPRIR